MAINRGDVTWVDYGEPRGSDPGKRLPAVVIQDDRLNASRLEIALMVPLTTNIGQALFPGNVLVPAPASGLDRDTVAIVNLIGPIIRDNIHPNVIGHLPAYLLSEISQGVRLVLGI